MPKKSKTKDKNYLNRWWHLLKYSPNDSRYYQTKYPHIVAIGGGSGLSSLLRGLKHYTPNITAVVAVTDNGQSSGLLRKAFNTLPPGDIRKCICALSPDEDLLVDLLSYRFSKGRGLNGHSLGNLLMVALSDIEKGFDKAVMGLSGILKTVGQVLPVTLNKVHLIGQMQSGAIVEGETEISKHGHEDPISRVTLSAEAKLYPPVKEAILSADIIIIGPGSLFTSIMPPLIVRGMSQSLKKAKAPIYYVCNTSTERGETEGYGVEDHIRVVKKAVSKIDMCIVNSKRINIPKIPEGSPGSIHQLLTIKDSLLGVKIISAKIIDGKNPLCHNSALLAKVIIDAYNGNERSVY